MKVIWDGTKDFGPNLISIWNFWSVVDDQEMSIVDFYSGDGGEFRLAIRRLEDLEEALEMLKVHIKGYSKPRLGYLLDLVGGAPQVGVYTDEGKYFEPLSIKKGDVLEGTVAGIAGTTVESSFGRYVDVGERNTGLLHCQDYQDRENPPKVGDKVVVKVMGAGTMWGRIDLTMRQVPAYSGLVGSQRVKAL